MREHLSRVTVTGFALAVIILIFSGWLSYYNIRRLWENGGRVTRTHELINDLEQTVKTLVDAETSQRGYIITGDKNYLDPYISALRTSKDNFDQLEKLTADNPAQQALLAKLRKTVEARLAAFRDGIAARDAEGFEGGQRVVLTGTGKREMDNIRAQVAEMQQVEEVLLKMRQDESRHSYQTTIGTHLATTLLGLVLVGSAYFLATRELRTRRAGIEALSRANDELEERVATRTADLGEANESLRRSNRELEQFASVASHDLQEPLRKIQAFGDRLKTRCSAELGEQGSDYLERMLASAGRMRSLIDALLSYSRVTTKAQPFAPVNLETTASEVVSDLEAQIHRSGGRVELEDLPTLEADPLQMRQLLQNLIGNALKFARPGEAPLVRVKSRPLGPNGSEIPLCEVSVSDNGIGFEEVYLDRIFELFQRLHGRQEYEGTGMGLAIVRKIVERHGGSITAKSTPGEGATFLVTLPLRQN